MQTDELRAELTDLANEVEPFAGDIAAVRRRVARRRLAVGSIGSVVAIGLVVILVSVGVSRSSKVDVASSVKDVSASDLQRFDAAVVLPAGATSEDAARVQRVLNSSDAVVQYTALPAKTVALEFAGVPWAKSVKARACVDPSTRSFAVALARPAAGALRRLTTAVDATATVEPTVHTGVDIEVFMNVKATDQQILEVHNELARDPDIAGYRFLDHADAYREFKRLFADQPVLIQHETPAGLPTSFRLTIRSGVAGNRVATRYERVSGVDTALVYMHPLANLPHLAVAQVCTNTP
jgi:hypothetical protein